jgi:hypothetical protein
VTRLAPCLLALAACGTPGAYTCTTSDQCVSHGVNGTCEAQGFCSFSDPSCPSGRRFEPNAGGGLGGTCATGVLVDAPVADTSDGAKVDATPVAIAFVQATAAKVSTATSQQLAFTKDVAAHDAVIVCFNYNSPGTATVTDTQGNRYAPVVGPIASTTLRLNIFVAFDVAGGPDTVNIALTVAPTSSFEAYIHDYAGLVGFDTGAAGEGTSAATDAMSSGTAITSYSNELIFGYGITGTAAAGTGFTVRSAFDANITEDELAATPGTYQAVATMVSGTNWTMLMAAFRGY